MEVANSVKIAIVKRNLQAVATQLYDLELNARAANRAGNKDRVAAIEKDIRDMLAAQDVFQEELDGLQATPDEAGEGPQD
jgi:hypothetical protein